MGPWPQRCRPGGHRAPVGLLNSPGAGEHVGLAIDAGPGRGPVDEARMHQLADEQAALRRVATLVARGARPAEVFSAVADELGHLIGAEATFVSRVELSSGHRPGPADEPSGEHGEPEGTCVVAASYGRTREEIPVGFRIQLMPGTVDATALRTGRPARLSGDQLTTGPYGELTRKLGLRAAEANGYLLAGGRKGTRLNSSHT